MLGIAIETIAYLVLAVIAIAVIFVVLSGLAPKIPNFIMQTFDSFKTWLCGTMGWGVDFLCKRAAGV
ncbi:hypothetical protein EPN87_02645 [archaeon]|nr:MAG: hypothetical protein EPN87_02645 [archaeon]